MNHLEKFSGGEDDVKGQGDPICRLPGSGVGGGVMAVVAKDVSSHKSKNCR